MIAVLIHDTGLVKWVKVEQSWVVMIVKWEGVKKKTKIFSGTVVKSLGSIHSLPLCLGYMWHMSRQMGQLTREEIFQGNPWAKLDKMLDNTKVVSQAFRNNVLCPHKSYPITTSVCKKGLLWTWDAWKQWSDGSQTFACNNTWSVS